MRRPALSCCRLIAGLAWLLSMNSPQTADAARRPNVVFIIADDLGYAELGAYGQQKIKTPHLDEMATEGMRLTNHYCGNPVCATSRCVLMTGKHSGHAYVRDNRELKNRITRTDELPEVFGGQEPIPSAEVTLGELFKAQGYATAAFGKWGLGGEGTTGDPLDQGFDRFFGYNCQRHAHNYYPRYLVDDRGHRVLKGNDRGLTGTQYAPDLCATEALAFIREHKDQPFFVYYPTVVPHLALQVPDDSLSEYEGQWDDPPYEGKKGYLAHPKPRAAYAAMITRMDRDIGRMLDQVKSLGLDDNTIFVFTSDNGPTYDRLGGSDSEFFGSAGVFRGLKGSIYEGGIRVPAIVRWPGHVPTDTVSDLPTAFYDWMPTLMDLIGAPDATPAASDGMSFAPTLLGHPEKQRKHDYLVWEFLGYGGQQAVRMGDWKGVRQNLKPRGKAEPNLTVELYNLKDDPAESHDVAQQHPEVVDRIEEIMRREHTVSPAFAFPALDAMIAQ
ncbi:MAG: arylsulfatase [Planctomycetaceae bacterium]